ncbi:T9SS type A sorting domain-containing protein [Aquimarina aggregata]|uniref:T9SS type A sorting domain-containing protein n=1 Tax=Aquimarina aggregata TaxID=1642818 RepID=UPI002492FC82|nr:T9SS type A sorting domain-containing protein [Aquimarina aggregata]
MKNFFLSLLCSLPMLGFAQFEKLIPSNTATHTAVKSGNWSDSSTWGVGQGVPGLASIVIIPQGITVNYDVNSNAHVFAIRLDGKFEIDNPNSPMKLVVDSFMGGANSILKIIANSPSSSTVEIILKPFNINRKNRGLIGGANWNNNAKNHYKDGGVVKDHFGANLPSDGPGVLGRYSWDPKQATIALMTHGKVRIKGQDKVDFSECSKNIGKDVNKIDLKERPIGWKVGDQVLLAGTKNKSQNEIFTIRSISGNSVTVDRRTVYNHQGVSLSGKNYYTYTGNLTRNIVIRSEHTDTQVNLTRRGHVMFMFNGDVRVRNAQFKDLGRTDKSNMLDDLKIGVPKIINVNGGKDVILPNLVNELETNPSLIENQRGRYALHFHKTLRGRNSDQLASATGNVIWGSPGWGMVHHDSHAEFADNVVLEIEGGAMVAESGSETGIWKHNFVTGGKNDVTVPFLNNERLSAPMKRKLRNIIDDDFKLPLGFCLQGRAIEMVDNVAASLQIGYTYQGNGDQVIVADKLDTKIYEASGKVNPFPFDKTINRTLAPFIRFDNNITFNAAQGFKSQTRNHFGAYHRVNSVINNLVSWNISTFGIYISSNFGYLVNDSKFHSINTSDSNNTAALIHIGNDNLSFNNTKFYNWKNTGAQVTLKDGRITSNPKAQFIFNKVQWIGSPSSFNPYRIDPNNNIKRTNINVNPNYKVRFTKANNMDDVINLNRGDFSFNVRGKVVDQAGNSDFGNYSPNKGISNLTRVYNFKNREDIINKLLKGRPSLSDARGQYIEFVEYISNRISDVPPTPVKIKIYVKGYNFSKTQNQGLNNDNFVESVKVYPNPTNMFITIFNPNETFLGRVRIFDISGKKLFDNIYTKMNKVIIDVSNLEVGTYFVKTNSFSKSFLIKK